ncbi:DUF3231 family protein [Neobacillus ginsengisoli]|uniref:DUF3231 family protein n=1 Tax=Neobacillus ginsengisoli TaxID=904295 RepID=UPI0027D8DE11|nr:DUF3231 family protein [Neobacillus ginsengisoli]
MSKKRSLNSAEAGNIYFNLAKTRLANGVSLEFSQVTKNKELRKYLETNIGNINKNFGIFSSLLLEDNLHVPQLLNTLVTNSTVAPI